MEAELNNRQQMVQEQSIALDGNQITIEPEDRSVAHVDGNSLYEQNENKGWFREGKHGREVQVDDIKVEPVRNEQGESQKDEKGNAKYRMTAVINGQIKHQIEDQQKTALLQNTIAAEFTQIHKWEKKYNNYLKTASGYASTLKACTSLYDDGVRIFINLCHLKKAIANNPQSVVATMNMNNLYIETATELVTVYTTLKEAIAKGGKENMLTGADRSKTLWELNDRMAQFNKKLTRLSLSIRYYTMARCMEQCHGSNARPKQCRDSRSSTG